MIEEINKLADKAAATKFVKDNGLKSDIKDETEMDIIKAILLEEVGTDEEEKPENDTPEEEVGEKKLTVEQIVKQRIKAGAKTYTRVVVNCNVTEFETWCRLSLTLDKPIIGYQAIEDKVTGEITYKKGITKVIFVSLFGVNAALKENKEARFAANEILSNHEIISPIIINSTVKILSEEVPDGIEYVAPFAENPEPTTFDGDRIINNVYNIALDNTGKSSLMLLKMKKLGMMPSFMDIMNML